MTTNFPGDVDDFPTNKTNFLPQVNDHPTTHNNTAAAINAIEDFLMGFTPAVTNPNWGAAGADGTGPGQFGTIPELVADGSTDDTAALQAAIDAASGGDVILLPKGWIAVTHITINKSLSIYGAGITNTLFIPLSATQDCISVNVGQAGAANNIILRDFGITPRAGVSPTITAGAMLAIGYIGSSQFHNIYVSAALGAAPFVGVRAEAPLQTTFFGFISGCSSDGMLISPAAIGGDVNDFYVLDGSRIDANAGYGINISNTVSGRTIGGVFIEHVSLWGNGSGIRMSTAAGAYLYNILLKGTMVDSSTTGHGIEITGVTDIFNVEFSNVWNASNAGHGYFLQPNARGIKIFGGKVVRNGTHGLFMLYAHEVEVDAVELVSNSQNASGVSYAIYTYDTTGQIMLNNVKIWNDPNITNKQNGLHIDPNTADVVVNGGMSITGAATTPLSDAGTRTVFNSFLAGTTYSDATLYNTPQNINVILTQNIGTGTDDLHSYTLRADAFNRDKAGIRITAWGGTANNVNAKTLALLFGGTTVFSQALTVSQTSLWRVVCEVWQNQIPGAQKASAHFMQTGTVSINTVFAVSPTEVVTSPIIVKFTGTATTNADIIQQGMLVEYF